MNTPARNQLCPCSSGKKYKHCCARRVESRSPMINITGATSVPLTKAFQIALQHHQGGQPRKAQAIYQQILNIQPGHFDALHLLGLVNHQLGNHELAYSLLKKAVSINPSIAPVHNNLGEVCRALKQFDLARACYEKALSIQQIFPEAYCNIGLMFQDQGLMEQAELHLRNAAKDYPNYAKSYLTLGIILMNQHRPNEALVVYNNGLEKNPAELSLLSGKGLALRALGEVDEGIAHYQHALVLHPDIAWLHHNLAMLFQNQGDFNAAITSLQNEISLDPQSESAKHLLAALQHTRTDSSPAKYVRDIFDGCADIFDELLVGKLEYRTPTLLADILQKVISHSPVQFDILDLGCGTGLFGHEVKNISKTLIGIDLSPKMIQKARERGIYDRLIVGDLLDYLNEVKSGGFNLIAAADVFNYVGNLEPAFKQIARILPSGGWFIFSLEVATKHNTESFTLDHTGRFQHGGGYTPRLCEQYDFETHSFTLTTLRMEKGKPVEGYLYLLKKTG